MSTYSMISSWRNSKDESNLRICATSQTPAVIDRRWMQPWSGKKEQPAGCASKVAISTFTATIFPYCGFVGMFAARALMYLARAIVEVDRGGNTWCGFGMSVSDKVY